MNSLDKRYTNTGLKVEPKEEQRRRLSSNNVSDRCSSFGVPNPNKISEDAALDYLARILVEIFLAEEYDQRTN